MEDSLEYLRRYLIKSSQVNHYDFTEEVREELRSLLFHTASVESKYILDFFPNAHNDDGPDDCWVMRNNSGIDPSHPGRPCLQKFEEGDATFRCL